MPKNLFVAGIPYDMDDAELKQIFEDYGTVNSARVITDRETGKSRGFGFVEMADDTAGRNAINELNGADFLGKNLVVNEARPREDRPAGGGNRGGGGFRRNNY